MAPQFHTGSVYRIRYGGKKVSSTQGRSKRKVRVIKAPHCDDRYKDGPVIAVEDLSDPNGSTVKTFYVHRILGANG